MEKTTLRLFKTKAEVANRIDEMAEEILQRYGNASPLFVCLLRGAAPFTAQLMFAVTRLNPSFHPELDYMTVSTYGDARVGREPKVVMDLSPSTNVSKRHVVILDDILDKGLTSAFTAQYLLNKGASQVDLIVLAQKDTPRSTDSTATIYGFVTPDEWLVGMGMDDARVAKDGYRWLDYLAIAEEVS